MRMTAMISLTIDHSVLAFFLGAEDIRKECIRFRGNIFNLYRLETKPYLTISYMGLRPSEKFDCFPDKEDLFNVVRKEEIPDAPIDAETCEKYYESILEKIKCRTILEKIEDPTKDNDKKQSVSYRGSGIHSNSRYLPNPEFDDPKPCYSKKHGKLKLNYLKYAYRLSKFNAKYHTDDINVIVIDGDQELVKLPIKFKKSDERQTNDTALCIIGIRKIKDIIDQYADNSYTFSAVSEASDAAKKDFGNELVFLPDVNSDRIKKELSPDAGPPLKIYYYLRTLSELVRMNEKEAFFPMSNDYIYKENDNEYIEGISEMVNAWGCICSKESYKKYIKTDCIERKFSLTENEKKVFTLHLKPCTNKDDNKTSAPEKSKTVRIYFDMQENKFRIASIGKHPVNPKFCKNEECKNYPCYKKESTETAS
jgi:hypothetical protein